MFMKKTLFAWLGKTDIRASLGEFGSENGPLLQGIIGSGVEEAHILSNYSSSEMKTYQNWINGKTSAVVTFTESKLTSPTNHHEIFNAVDKVLGAYRQKEIFGTGRAFFHLSPGTPAMSAIWLLMSKTKYPAKLIETSREAGYNEVSVPFEISAEYIPDLKKASDYHLKELNLEKAPQMANFSKIIHKSAPMKRVIHRAIKVAERDVPVLIEGESGTGKELFARAIHQSSSRSAKPFIAVNCGAIPKDLVESELFGHKKSSFTGATSDRKGHFETANGGTVFLDELGELPLSTQVKLLRVIQESEVTPIGASLPIRVDVRIISATHRDLIQEIAEHRFREDLFYRLAVAVLKLPPLRERAGDLGVLIDYLLTQVNLEYEGQKGYDHKKISAPAKNLMLNHSWPGNIRELQNTLRRVAIWSEGETISEVDAKESILPTVAKSNEKFMDQPLGDKFNINELLGKIASAYLVKAYKEAGGNKTQAAKLLGLPNYQTFSNWVDKYGAKL
jgi:transcriptional regulator with PAS, ATPase and Fis domain